MQTVEATTSVHRSSWMAASISVRMPAALIIGALVVGLVTVNWIFLARNQHLQRALVERQKSLYPKVGTVVPSFDGVALDGTPLHVDSRGDSRPTLLLIFSSTCPICEVNWPYWEHLAQSIDRNRYRVVYVNLSESLPASYLQKHYFAPEAVVFAKLDPKAVVAYSFSVTPVVAVIGPDGVIQRLWIGRSHLDEQRSIDETLGLTKLAQVQ